MQRQGREWSRRGFLGAAAGAAGVLATGGGVVFAGSKEGNLIALDGKSGKALWHFQTGAEIPSSPMSYAIDGRQYVAISSANVLYSFALPKGDSLSSHAQK